MASKKRILITTGDEDGIGWEVTAKALASIGPLAGIQFALIRAENSAKISRKAQSFADSLKSKIRRKFKISTGTSLEKMSNAPHDPKTILEILRKDSPAHWVQEAAQACMSQHFDGLVTAPLSKTCIREAGLDDLGHTEILARISQTRDLFMGFLGRKFSVVLATGHLPTAGAIAAFSPQLLTKAVEAAESLRALLPPHQRKKAIAVVGINPHASESGLIGKDDLWIEKFTQDLRPKNSILGPLVPDAAFLPHQWTRISVYISPYHDQGLIPFKLVHGFDEGVHLTLGLPFIRTSVDHGCAKEIFGHDKAKHGSMKDALLTAVRLSQRRVL